MFLVIITHYLYRYNKYEVCSFINYIWNNKLTKAKFLFIIKKELTRRFKRVEIIKTNRQRIEWIDIAKGLGILCVFFGHFSVGTVQLFNIQTQLPKFLVYSFHMPLFFFLSGYCFSKKHVDFKTFAIKKFTSLMIPYITFSIIWILYDCLLQLRVGNLSIDIFVNEIKTYLVQIRVNAIWFLPCLFLIELVFYWIRRISKDKSVGILTVGIIFTVLGYLYRNFININLFWNSDVVPSMILFFIIGYIVKNITIFQNQSRKMQISLFAIFSVSNILLNTINLLFFEPHKVSVFGNNYCNYLLFYSSAFFGIFAIIELSKLLENNRKIITYIGANSLVYFGLHQIIYNFCQIILDHFTISNIAIWISYFAIMIMSILILTLLNIFMNKTKFRVLLGKFH